MSVVSELSLPELSLAEASVGARANMVPAEIVVSSNLAEDTVIAHGMNIAAGVNKQALFANPLSGGGEEMLFLDDRNLLWWVRHVNPDTVSAGEPVWAPKGWAVEPVGFVPKPGERGSTLEVVVAVHPSGQVCAFVLVDAGDSTQLHGFELVADPGVLGGQRWKMDIYIANERRLLAGLQVYYCNDRPATPFVFLTEPAAPRLLWFAPSFPSDPVGFRWHKGGEFVYDAADRGVPVLAGVDSPVEVGNKPTVSVVRLWAVVEGSLWLTTHWPSTGGSSRWQLSNAAWSGLVGAFAHPAGAGVVGTTSAGNVELAVGLDSIAERLPMPALDQPLGDLVAWQDAENYLHLYGRDQKAVLNAVHQTGWVDDGLYGLKVPVWDSHQASGAAVLTTRPLVGQVATYVMDAFPDLMPNQHVMHQGVVASEACAIYTQDVRTSFWSQEKIRIVPGKDTALPAPNTVPRYQTSLVVKDGYGAPMAGVGVELSADVPVDLEVAGQFYRTGAVTPITLTTDLRGQVTLRVVAAGLTVPDLYVTVPGLDQSLTLQMAGDVHKFLAGNAALPNFGDGFTPEVVSDATIPGTTTKLFPNLAPADRQDAVGVWQPTAAEVVGWCAGAFAIDTNSPLPAAMTAGLAQGEQVLAFTIQTHDPDRPGYQVYTSPDQLEARRQALAAKGGFITDLEDWVGDVWQGIRQGVTEVTEVTLYSEDKLIDLAVTLADGTLSILHLTWDDILGAAQAVEAVFVAIGATIQDTLAWLKWAFDFADAFLTAKALEGVYRQMPALTKPALEDLKKLASGWFVARESDVSSFFEDMKTTILPGKTVGSTETPLAGTPTNVPVPPTGQSTDQLQSPHTSWLTEKVFGVEGSSSSVVSLPSMEGILDDLWELVTTSSAWPDLQKAWEDVGKLWTNLFDAADAQTAIAQELVTILDLLEHVVNALLKFLDDVVQGFINLGERGLTEMVALFESPLVVESSLISTLWDFMVTSAGLDIKDHPLTMGSLAMLLGAYPTTLVYKIMTGSAPFPDGVVNGFGTSAGQSGKGPASLEYLTVGQQVGGVIAAFMAVFDITLNSLCLAGPAERLAPVNRQKCVLAWSLLSCVRLFPPIFSAPQLWGYDMKLDTAKEKVLWATFGIDVAYGILDQGFSFISKSPLERFVTWETEKPYNLFGIAVSSAYGLARMISSIFEWRTSPPTWFSTQETVANALRWVPQATGVVRYLYDKSPSPGTGTAVIAKMVADVGFDVYYGGLRTAHARYERAHPPSISGADPLVLKAGTQDKPYQSDDVQVTGGMPEYSWEAVRNDTQTGLPKGLQVERVSWPDDLGQHIGVRGTPLESGTFTFSLSVHDGYVPSIADTRPCEITVYGKPAAGFTANPSTGPAPLTVVFTDTSSGIPTAWSWDFGNGQTSTEQNPSAVFEAPGVYDVSLTVTNPAGTSTPSVQKITVV